MVFNPRLSRPLTVVAILFSIILNSTGAFAQNYSYDNKMGEIESIRKSICVNGLWSSACSSDSNDILSCDRKYTGQQAQRICQYEKGLEGRRLAWVFKEIEKRAEAEAKQERLQRIAAADAETKRKIAEAQAREVSAQDCIKYEAPVIREGFKKVRDFAKKRVGTDLQLGDFDLNLDLSYGGLPGIISIPEIVRPVLSNATLVFRMETSCDSATNYLGYIVSLDALKIDGFLAYRVSPNRPDGIGRISEINELEWLGPRIKAEEKRLKAVKAESDRLNLEKLKVEADRKAAEEAKAKAQAENYKSFLIWVILVLGLIGAFAIYFLRRPSRKITHAVTDEELSSPADIKYNFTPSTKDQITMQNAFRGKYPFVKYSVRFEHMASFIEGCIKHNAENGSFPSQDEQHQILLKLDSSRV